MIYPLILSGYLLVTIFLHITFQIKLWKNSKEKKAVIIWFIIIFITGTLFDFFATYKKIWIFPGNGITGLRIFWLPIEEFFFFLIIPYFVLVLYKVLNKVI